MTDEQIKSEIQTIEMLAKSNYFTDGNSRGISFSLKYIHNFYINNDPNGEFTHNVPLDSFEDAVKIVQGFSGESYESVEKSLMKQSFREGEKLYLYYQKSMMG